MMAGVGETRGNELEDKEGEGKEEAEKPLTPCRVELARTQGTCCVPGPGDRNKEHQFF